MLKRLLSWALAGLLVVAGSLPIEARPGHGGLAAGTCVEFINSSGVGDGNCEAPAGTPDNITLWRIPTFFTGYSGINYGANRPAWSVAGVDYNVGIPAGTVFKDPYVEYLAGRLPAGVTVNPTGNSIGGGLISYTGSANLTLDKFDYSGTLTGGGVCYVMANTYSGSAGTGVLTLSNSYFNRGTGCYGNSNSGFNDQIFPGQFATLNFTNDVWDFSPQTTGAGFKPISIGPTNLNVNVYYSVFNNIPENPINGSAGTNLSFKFRWNLVNNYTFSGSQNHSEIADLNGVGERLLYDWEFATIFRGNQTTNSTANIWVSDSNSSSASTFDTVNVLNNSIVAVPYFSGGVSTNVNVADFNNLNNGPTTIDSNWTDGTGATYHSLAQNTVCKVPVVFTNNFNLTNGSLIPKGSTNQPGDGLFHAPLSVNLLTTTIVSSVMTVGSTSGGAIRNFMTITGIPGASGTITISSFGTGTGGAGTYNLAGSPPNMTSQTIFAIDGC